jgi:hypothetical protein
VRNPLRSEDAAFRFVLWTIAYFVPIVVAAWIATWLGAVVFVAETVVVGAIVWTSVRSSRPTAEGPERAQVEDTPPQE